MPVEPDYWSNKELIAYEAELKRKRDERAVYDQKVFEGEIKGEAKGQAAATLRIAKQLLIQGYKIKAIQTATGLPPEELKALRKELLPAKARLKENAKNLLSMLRKLLRVS